MPRVEEMTFPELVEALWDLEQERERTSGPLDLERTVARRAIDLRLARLLSGARTAEERRACLRVPGELPVHLRFSEQTVEAVIVDLGEGGLRVRSQEALPEPADVEVELGGVPEAERPPRARARVSWTRAADGGYEAGLQFVGQPELHRQRMRRLVLGILRQIRN